MSAGELAPLVECPRCGGWSLDPDRHLLGVVGTWRGGPLPRLRYCTPGGVTVEDSPAPPPPRGVWGWTSQGYRPVCVAEPLRPAREPAG